MLESTTIDAPAGRFAALACGDPGAPVALCLHGFPDHPPSFEPVLRRLADAGYRAVAPWMRGYYPSPLDGPYHVDRIAEDVIELATILSPRYPIALVGHDWGAVAAYMAMTDAPDCFFAGVTMSVPHPLALLANMPRYPRQLKRSWYMLFFQAPALAERAVAANDFYLIDRLWQTWSPGLDANTDRRELKACLARSMPAPIEYYRAIARPLREARARIARRARQRIQVPTLHLTGADDGCIAPELGEEQATYFTGPFESRVLPGVGHFLQLENPDLVASNITGWIQRHRTAA